MKTTTQEILSCDCGATARNTTKERGRFLRRHPITPATSDYDIDLHCSDQRHLKKLALDRTAILKQKTQSAAVATAIVGAAIAAAVKGAR